MKTIKLGHQAPKPLRINNCNSIEIEGDLHYCSSHNFVYNEEEEDRKLHNGEACFYTDNRFVKGPWNFYNNTKLHWTRWRPISLKSAIRKIQTCKGIPIGTIVDLNKSWYYRGKKIDNSYKYKVRKENPIDIKYEVNIPNYFKNFTNCKRSQILVEELRKNGFLVYVKPNESFIKNMINAASVYTGNKNQNLIDACLDGEVAIAYGYGKRIGFSSFNNDFQGYSIGENSILWDKFGEFDKWSRCEEISKDTPIEEILKILKE